MDKGTEAQKYVWEGAIPLQIHLHESEVTTLPPPPPALILAPRIGYLPLLIPQIKPFFSNTLPPGVDTIWFDYKGLPLKWYIPTGVLFDLLCAKPERPWNLTVHFRGYPGNVLIPCEGEDSVKWSLINSLKEAAYIINGNCKNVMNMSQSDQVELWHSVLNGDLTSYLRVSSKLKLGILGDTFSERLDSSSLKSQQNTVETDATGPIKPCKFPVRLYIWNVNKDFNLLEDAPSIDSWDQVYYINRPVEITEEGTSGKHFTLLDAIRSLVPEFFTDKFSTDKESCGTEVEEEEAGVVQDKDAVGAEEGEMHKRVKSSFCLSENVDIKLLRIQGIKPQLNIPFAWVANNLKNPENFLHICVYVKGSEPVSL